MVSHVWNQTPSQNHISRFIAWCTDFHEVKASLIELKIFGAARSPHSLSQPLPRTCDIIIFWCKRLYYECAMWSDENNLEGKFHILTTHRNIHLITQIKFKMCIEDSNTKKIPCVNESMQIHHRFSLHSSKWEKMLTNSHQCWQMWH